MKEVIIVNSKDEFELMFKEYIVPLLGISNNNSQYSSYIIKKNDLVLLKNQKLYFFDSKDSDNCFIVQVSKNFPKSSLKLLRKVYSEMMQVRHRNYDDSIKNKYDSLQHLRKNYEYQLQKSLLNWFSGDEANLLELIEKLEYWKEKTYEGKKVPFAFLIDKNKTDGEKFV